MNPYRCCTLVLFCLQCHFLFGQSDSPSTLSDSISKQDIKVIIPTFLGNEKRNFYGSNAPDTLELIWKYYLGKGITVISRKLGSREWAGAGWTGQPLLIEEDSTLFIIQGAFDHHLKKLNASTGTLVWQYKFDDVVKGTGTFWSAPDSFPPENRLIILQGSRLGVGNYLDSKHIPSFRAISYFTGKELWRLDVKWTDSYSRDVDGSALILNDTAYIGLENSLFTVLDPSPCQAKIKDGMLQPKIIREIPLYTQSDAVAHKGNIVTESSPCLLDSVIYIASGSGHVYGYGLREKRLVWDFYIGSDIDGSAIVTRDSCLLVTVEKQYIEGRGGVFKLDPSKPADSAVVWYFPVEDREHASWEGGVIGSASVNDYYNHNQWPDLAAFTAIDGYLYVVIHTEIDPDRMVDGPQMKKKYPTPRLVFKYKTGASISTPLFVDDKIIAAGYGGIYLFSYNEQLHFNKLARFVKTF
jgi:outer membrane protein assembly factor BamB